MLCLTFYLSIYLFSFFSYYEPGVVQNRKINEKKESTAYILFKINLIQLYPQAIAVTQRIHPPFLKKTLTTDIERKNSHLTPYTCWFLKDDEMLLFTCKFL